MPSDPLAKARRAAAQMDTHRAALARLADQRCAAIRTALDSGMSRSEVAAALGISKQALAVILKRSGPTIDYRAHLADPACPACGKTQGYMVAGAVNRGDRHGQHVVVCGRCGWRERPAVAGVGDDEAADPLGDLGHDGVA